MIDPFKKINEENKKILLKNLEASTYHFHKGESIFSTVKLNNAIGIVVEGHIQNIKTDYNGNKIIIEELTKNSVFGSQLSFYIHGESEMIAKKDTDVIILDYSSITNFNSNNDPSFNQFIINLLDILNYIIILRNERIRILTTKTIRNKLLEYFDILANKQGTKIIRLPFTYTDLADYLAVDRSAMMREIKNLRDEKFIEVKSKRINLMYK